MKCKVGEKTMDLEFSGTAAELLTKLQISREMAIVKVNGVIVPDNDTISNSDQVEIMRVIYGG